MALNGRSVDSGAGIDVLVDTGATGDMQVFKLAISALGSQILIPADATNGLFVDVTRIAPGTTATALGKAEDAPAASGDVGVMALVVRRDTAVSDGANGDYAPLHVDALGRLWITGTQLEDAPAASGNSGIAVLGVRNDALTALTSTDGDYGALAIGSAGEQFATPTASGLSANTAPTNATTTAYAASLVVKAAAGTLLRLCGYNSDAAQFLQIHNTASLPADAAVPVVLITIPATSNFSIDFGLYGRRFATGITICNSSTGPTKTIGAANLWLDVQYK